MTKRYATHGFTPSPSTQLINPGSILATAGPQRPGRRVNGQPQPPTYEGLADTKVTAIGVLHLNRADEQGPRDAVVVTVTRPKIL